MAPFNWEFDSDIGVYKNRYLSDKMLVSSLVETKIVPFTSKVEGFGKQQGEWVNIMHVNELPQPADARLDEETRIPIDKITYGERPIKVYDWGRGCEYTDLAVQLGKFDPASVIQKALMRQMNGAMDTAAADAFQNTDVKICFVPTAADAGTFYTTGSPGGAAAASNITFVHMGILADYLSGDIHCPPYTGEDYIMLSCRKTLRGLKSDSLWQNVHLYLQKGDLFFKGENGKAENIRCVQVDREEAISNTAGASAVLGDAMVFGDEAVSRVEVMTPQLFADPNYQSDFGRTKAIAWRGIISFASTWNVADDRKAKVIRITST